jgi:hypothetical protein
MSGEFRPISIIHGVQMILSKILVERLQPYMNDLILPTQIDFLKGRNIYEGFHYVQEVITTQKQSRQVALFKAYIFKVFDSLN